MKNITLVQKVVDLSEYQKLVSNNELPLVLRLTDFEISLLEKDKNFKSSNISLLYYPCNFPISNDKNHYLYLDEERLADFIEWKIFNVSLLITKDKKIKYVDYISRSHSIDFGGRIVFRPNPRKSSRTQASYSKRKNRLKITPAVVQLSSFSLCLPTLISSLPSFDSEEVFSLCLDAVYSQEIKEKEASYQKKM